MMKRVAFLGKSLEMGVSSLLALLSYLILFVGGTVVGWATSETWPIGIASAVFALFVALWMGSYRLLEEAQSTPPDARRIVNLNLEGNQAWGNGGDGIHIGPA